jgi:tRNA(Phe) wybutosine-synthesizing methylase Tyw3
LLNIATVSGYRESGISISSTSTPQEKVLVAIRTTAIRLDIPLAYYDENNRTIRLLGLTRGYLCNLFGLVNDKFQENEERKQSLIEALQKSFTSPKVESTQDTKEERRIEKRLEGLRKQAAGKQVNNVTTTMDTDMDLDLLDILN